MLTGERCAGGGVEAVAAVSAVAAGDVIIRVFGCRERRAVVHLFVSSFEAEGRPCLHGNSVSEGREQQASQRHASPVEDTAARYNCYQHHDGAVTLVSNRTSYYEDKQSS